MIRKKNTTGIVLAGGKSLRMGIDKGFLRFHNKTFVQCSIDALKPLVSDIIIVSDDSNYDILGYKRVTDFIKDAGPVSGIYSGLTGSKSEYNIILSCDIPLISSEVLQKLIDAVDNTSDIIQIESHGKSMPLVALYKQQVKDVFYKLLKNDEHRLRVAVKHCKFKNVVLDKTLAHTTMNINTKDEFNKIVNVDNP